MPSNLVCSVSLPFPFAFEEPATTSVDRFKSPGSDCCGICVMLSVALVGSDDSLDDDATACSPIAPGEGVLAVKYGRVLRRIPAMCFLEGALPEGEEVEVEAGDLSRCSGTTVEVVGQTAAQPRIVLYTKVASLPDVRDTACCSLRPYSRVSNQSQIAHVRNMARKQTKSKVIREQNESTLLSSSCPLVS
jgi:hypothetical protein